MKLYTQVVEFIRKHNIEHASHNVRPWGAYDLVMRLEGKVCVTNRTFGFGFTTEEASAIMIYELIEPLVPDASFLVWLGEERQKEIITIVEEIKKQEEVQEPITDIQQTI